jgi:hypothetical protein
MASRISEHMAYLSRYKVGAEIDRIVGISGTRLDRHTLDFAGGDDVPEQRPARRETRSWGKKNGPDRAAVRRQSIPPAGPSRREDRRQRKNRPHGVAVHREPDPPGPRAQIPAPRETLTAARTGQDDARCPPIAGSGGTAEQCSKFRTKSSRLWPPSLRDPGDSGPVRTADCRVQQAIESTWRSARGSLADGTRAAGFSAHGTRPSTAAI